MKHNIKSIIKSAFLIILYLLSVIFLGNKVYFESGYQDKDNYNISRRYDDEYMRITKTQYVSYTIYFVIPDYKIYPQMFEVEDTSKIKSFGNRSPIYETDLSLESHDEVDNPSNLYNIFFKDGVSVANNALKIDPNDDNHKSIYTPLTDDSTLPSSDSEIALTDVIFDLYSSYGIKDSKGNVTYPKDYSDLIGREYVTSGKTYKICGIFSTIDSSKYQESKDAFMSNDPTKLTMELRNLKFAYQHIVYGDGNGNNSHTAIVKLTDDERANKDFISSFRSKSLSFGGTLNTFIFGWGVATMKACVDVSYTEEYSSKMDESHFFSYNYAVSVMGVISYLLLVILSIIFLCQWFKKRFSQLEFKDRTKEEMSRKIGMSHCVIPLMAIASAFVLAILINIATYLITDIKFGYLVFTFDWHTLLVFFINALIFALLALLVFAIERHKFIRKNKVVASERKD